MKPEEVKWNDWSRILLGQVPPEFYLELVIRAFLIYLLLQVSMRLLGKRMASRLSLTELMAMVALASAIGVPMLAYDRGILPSFIVAFIVVGITRLLAKGIARSEVFEKAAQGDIDILVEDSRLNIEAMKKVRISQDRLFAQIRSENIHHLGAIKRMYMEASGSFSLVTEDKKKPGLGVLPDWDTEFVDERLVRTDRLVCKGCGAESPHGRNAKDNRTACPNCGARKWTRAVIEKAEAA